MKQAAKGSVMTGPFCFVAIAPTAALLSPAPPKLRADDVRDRIKGFEMIAEDLEQPTAAPQAGHREPRRNPCQWKRPRDLFLGGPPTRACRLDLPSESSTVASPSISALSTFKANAATITPVK
jgi:hypothetical protein